MSKLSSLLNLLEMNGWVHPDAVNYFPSNVSFQNGEVDDLIQLFDQEVGSVENPGDPPEWVDDLGAWNQAKELAQKMLDYSKEKGIELKSGDSLYPLVVWCYLKK